jgi:hypothetical protein
MPNLILTLHASSLAKAEEKIKQDFETIRRYTHPRVKYRFSGVYVAEDGDGN